MQITPDNVSIVSINGVEYTVVWHGAPRRWSGDFRRLHNNALVLHNAFNRNHHIATALPPLPKHPTKDDAWLLHLYAAHGLIAQLQDREGAYGDFTNFLPLYDGEKYCVSFLYCTTESGERVSVAIKGE